MAKTAAQRQREYRARRNADPEKRRQYLRSERERWKRDTEAGKNKKISELSAGAKQQKRKMWREAKQRQKNREALRNIGAPPQNPADPPEPGTSRQHSEEEKPSREEMQKLREEIAELKQALKKERELKEEHKKRLRQLAKHNEPIKTEVCEPDKKCPVIHSVYVCEDYMLEVFDLKLKTP